jgi:hypothetical protein
MTDDFYINLMILIVLSKFLKSFKAFEKNILNLFMLQNFSDLKWQWIFKSKLANAIVAQPCNPNYLEGRDQESRFRKTFLYNKRNDH